MTAKNTNNTLKALCSTLKLKNIQTHIDTNST